MYSEKASKWLVFISWGNQLEWLQREEHWWANGDVKLNFVCGSE